MGRGKGEDRGQEGKEEMTSLQMFEGVPKRSRPILSPLEDTGR